MFIDDRLENVLAARSCGLLGVVYEARASHALEHLEQDIRNHIFDAVERGDAYMRAHSRRHRTFIENGVEIQENFAQLLIYALLGDR
jgi:hypothetical protein